MDYFDSEGFTILVHKKESTAPKNKAEKEKPKEKEKQHKIKFRNPFKKGTWKDWLFKKAKKWKSSKFISDFHFDKLDNILIIRGDDNKAIFSSEKFSKKQLQKSEGKGKEPYILINSSCNLYTRVSVECYQKLCEIERIALSQRITAEDDTEETFDLYDNEAVIDNICDLMDFINYQRQLVNGVYDIQANCCGFTYNRYKFKVVVLKKDGKVETYKGDFNDFLQAYSFKPLL